MEKQNFEENNFDQGYIKLAGRLAKEDLDGSYPEFSSEVPLLVWHCKALQNRKYVFGVPKAGILYEVTYNGNRDEWYVDRYKKEENTLCRGETLSMNTYIPRSNLGAQRPCAAKEKENNV